MPSFLQERLIDQRRSGRYARQLPGREEACQVVVPAARGDAAELLPAIDRGLEHDAGVVVESASKAKINCNAFLRHLGGFQEIKDRTKTCNALNHPAAALLQASVCRREDLDSAAAGFDEIEDLRGLAAGGQLRRFVDPRARG